MFQLGSMALNVALAAAVGSGPITVDATFAAVFVPDIPAVTYDPMVVPETGHVKLSVEDGLVTLWVAGLEPDTAFESHLHVAECGPKGEDAGGHYQNVPGGPENAQNEVWLNFTTDGQGVASAESRPDWSFDPKRPPRSLIIHNPAGDRLACVNVPASS